MKTLQRKHARVLIVLVFASIAGFGFLPVIMYDVIRAESPVWGIIGGSGAALGILASLVVKSICLRCPYCGKGVARPYWNAGEGHEQFCVKCGAALIYDDELKQP